MNKLQQYKKFAKGKGGNMKKKILFIEEGLGIGGAEKSLLAILSLIDYSKYDVDLFLFRHNGELMNMIPKEVNLLPLSKDFSLYEKNKKISPLNFLKEGNMKCFFYSIKYLISSLIHKVLLKKEYIGWNNIKHMFLPIKKEYDVAISFLEKKTIYFNVDKVKAKKRIGFVHIDYSKYPYNYKLDKKYFKYFTKIVTVSEHCKEVLENIFPEYKEKFCVIKNMISPEIINKMANEEIDLKINKNDIIIVTVGRLIMQKGIDNAILVCKELVDAGYPIRWYSVGKGGDKEKFEKMIKERELDNNFILTGAQLNPYKYIKACDIYVQPSRFEGYGITVAEAKALRKPIVATNIPEFKEQIVNGKTGLLVKDNKDMVKAIEKIINNKELKDVFAKNLNDDKNIVNEAELNKLYEIIER